MKIEISRRSNIIMGLGHNFDITWSGCGLLAKEGTLIRWEIQETESWWRRRRTNSSPQSVPSVAHDGMSIVEQVLVLNVLGNCHLISRISSSSSSIRISWVLVSFLQLQPVALVTIVITSLDDCFQDLCCSDLRILRNSDGIQLHKLHHLLCHCRIFHNCPSVNCHTSLI